MDSVHDYSKYKCPYEHLPKECGHKLKSPIGYEGTYSVWCACGFRGPVHYLDPKDLNLQLKETSEVYPWEVEGRKILKWRQSPEIGIEELSGITGFTISQIASFESGEKDPSPLIKRLEEMDGVKL